MVLLTETLLKPLHSKWTRQITLADTVWVKIGIAHTSSSLPQLREQLQQTCRDQSWDRLWAVTSCTAQLKRASTHSSGQPSNKIPDSREIKTQSKHTGKKPSRITGDNSNVQRKELTLTFFATFCDLLSSGEQAKITQVFPALATVGKS